MHISPVFTCQVTTVDIMYVLQINIRTFTMCATYIGKQSKHSLIHGMKVIHPLGIATMYTYDSQGSITYHNYIVRVCILYCLSSQECSLIVTNNLYITYMDSFTVNTLLHVFTCYINSLKFIPLSK